jgi:hypothetical protein
MIGTEEEDDKKRERERERTAKVKRVGSVVHTPSKEKRER